MSQVYLPLFFAMGIILIADAAPALQSSPVDGKTFSSVFSLSPIAVLASMMAYLLAQLFDIRIYHFWKRLTNGKHLWLRNNFSTFLSQIVDTSAVLILLCSFGVLSWNLFYGLLVSGVVFKMLGSINRHTFFIPICLFIQTSFQAQNRR